MKNKTNAVQVIARATRCPDFEPDYRESNQMSRL